jgi:tyrosinase
LPDETREPLVYDDLVAGTGLEDLLQEEDHLQEGTRMAASLSTEPPPEARLVGDNAAAVTVGAATVSTTVRLRGGIAGNPAERVFLNLENIRGTSASGVLNVLISAPAQSTLFAFASPVPVKSVALFGLAKASAPDGAHGGNGISIALDITEIAGQLAKEEGPVRDQFIVHLKQPGERESSPITVGRVSVYKQRK